MSIEELIEIADLYDAKAVMTHDDERQSLYFQFAEWIRDEKETLEDVDSEEELWGMFEELVAESNNFDDMFPNMEEDDDALMDYLTKDE